MTEKPDPFDVAALERSVNDSATRVSTIWVSYLIFALYLLITTGTATHRQLFLEAPVKLPALNIDLPLYSFFVLAPILFVLLHLYVLLQVLLLGRTAAAYNETVDKAIGSAPENAFMRQRLANTLFAQIFAGSPRERMGWLGWLLRAMAWVTLAFAPICVILAFQLTFLPYHSHFATWVHRLLLFAELAIAFLLWPLVLDARKDFNWEETLRRIGEAAAAPFKLLFARGQQRQERRQLRLRVGSAATCAALFAVSLLLATFPGEPHLNLLTGNSLFAVQCDRWIEGGLGFDRLVLSSIVVDSEKLDRIEKATSAKGLRPSEGERTQSLRERDLNCGAFYLADLRRTDFVGARLSGASFARADLRGADFSLAQLQGAVLDRAQLRGADLSFAHLQSVNLSYAQLQGADFTLADLQGADLFFAQLQGATFGLAKLQGAYMQMAQLQGADLRGAKFQGADMRLARLEGADLSTADWRLAQIDGAPPIGAQLQGANLDGAQLQGANLSKSELNLASFSDVSVWRARDADCSDARVIMPKFEAALSPNRSTSSQATPVPATPETIETFIADVVSDVDYDRKKVVEERLRDGVAVAVEKDDLAAIETNWRGCAANSEKTLESDYLQQHSDFLRDLICNASSSRNEITDGIIKDWGSFDALVRRDFSIPRLARGLLGIDGKQCAATKDLSDEIKGRLRRYASAPGN